MITPTRPAILKVGALLFLLILFGCQKQQPDRPLGNTHADSVAFMERHAEAGDTSAIVWLAQSDELDDGVVADTGRTLGMLRKAARSGSVQAMLMLGDATWSDVRSHYGYAENDFAAAKAWYRPAAAMGYAPAIGRLGRISMFKSDTPANADSAIYYLTLASRLGHARSWFWLGWLADKTKGKAPGFATLASDDTALRCYRKAAAMGDGDAAYALGDCYRDGALGLSRDYTSAVAFFRQASQSGDPWGELAIGEMYASGSGLPKDEAAAAQHFRAAAIRGVHDAQWKLGICYGLGRGVPFSRILAYAWYNLASTGDYTADNLEILRHNMTGNRAQLSAEDAELSERLASQWRIGQDLVLPDRTSRADDESAASTASGTAFVVSREGLALTNYHVVENARTIRVDGQEGVATVVAKDEANDLAVIKLPFRPHGSARFVPDPSRISLGEDVVVYGYPLKSVLSSGGNATTGTLSALTGLGNNASNIQITAAIQPGSSGSPVFDRAGHVIGIVVSKLDDADMVKATGNIGQTVNFAVNYATISAFLDASRVKYERAWPWPRFNRSTADIVRDAREWTYQLEISY